MRRSDSDVTVVIPARYGSTRLPGKPLLDLGGKTMIQHVYEQAIQAAPPERVIVATDDPRIQRTVQEFGGTAVLTDPACATGTDRLAEVARHRTSAYWVNLQGDLPFLPPAMLKELIDGFPAFSERASAQGLPVPAMGTLMRSIEHAEALYNPNVVKVVTDQRGFALYFSRSPIPYVRDPKSSGRYYKHFGLYIYTRDFLQVFTGLAPGRLEQMEKLEQLRALEHGYPIVVFESRHDCLEVDTAEDLEKARALLKKSRALDRTA